MTSGLDAVEMLMAGATTVGVGSAVYYRAAEAIADIHRELREWLDAHGTTVDEIRGLAHREPVYASTPAGAPVPLAH